MRSTRRTLGIGMSLFAVYNIGFSLYSHYRQTRFLNESESMIHQTAGIVNTMHQLQEAPLHDKSLLETIVEEIRGLRDDMQERNSCVAPQAVLHGYALQLNRETCALTVTIPYGGSISEASTVYFTDSSRWKQDIRWNRHISNPDHVPAGTQYTFYLPRK